MDRPDAMEQSVSGFGALSVSGSGSYYMHGAMYQSDLMEESETRSRALSGPGSGNGLGPCHIQGGMASGFRHQLGMHLPHGFRQILRPKLPIHPFGGSGSSMNALQNDTQPRKRGRPKKVPLGVGPSVPGATNSPSVTTVPSLSGQKRGRGRPPGPRNKQQSAIPAIPGAETAKAFTTHIITVEPGEDIAARISSFSQGPRSMSVLSATGSVSLAILTHTSNPSSIIVEGQSQIISLSGHYVVTQSDGPLQRSGDITVLLTTEEGSVLGGRVGSLIAASPVQVILMSFIATDPNDKSPRTTQGDIPDPKGWDGDAWPQIMT